MIKEVNEYLIKRLRQLQIDFKMVDLPMRVQKRLFDGHDGYYEYWLDGTTFLFSERSEFKINERTGNPYIEQYLVDRPLYSQQCKNITL
jgi:hypothetical protein